MSDEFDHVVMTRYSALFVPEQEPPEEEWLWYRLGFFADACVASMRAQTERDFRWLVWLDPRCSDDFRLEIERLSEGLYEPIWSCEVFWRSHRADVAARSSAPYLITTRLDNDDAVATDFIASIQAHVEPAERLVVDFPSGLQVDRSGAVYSLYSPVNHFASLIEQRTDALPVTVFVTQHPQLPKHAPVKRVRSAPMWLEVVHGPNVSNVVRGPRVKPTMLNRRFVLDLAYRSSVPASQLIKEKVKTQRTLTQARITNPRVGFRWARSWGQRVRGTRLLPRRKLR